MKGVVKGLREKLNEGFIAPPQPVHVIGPVDKQPAPYHSAEHRKIDPVVPADDERVFFYDFGHCGEVCQM